MTNGKRIWRADHDIGVNQFNVTGPIARKLRETSQRGTERVRIDVLVKHPSIAKRQGRSPVATVTYFGNQAVKIFGEVDVGDLVSCRGYIDSRRVDDHWAMFLHGKQITYLLVAPRAERVRDESAAEASLEGVAV